MVHIGTSGAVDLVQCQLQPSTLATMTAGPSQSFFGRFFRSRLSTRPYLTPVALIVPSLH